MDNIFNYRGVAQDVHFVGRETEIKKLSSDFIFLTNAAIIAPQGWGKSSLVRQAAKVASHKEKTLRFAYVDLSNVRNEEHFFELLVQGVLKAVSSSQKDVLDNVGKYFTEIHPKISFDSDSAESLNVDFDWEAIRKNQDFLLDFPSQVAKDKGVKMIVCIDDFHVISQFADPESLLDGFKARWSRQDGVSYCVCAAALAMVEKFISSTPIFYRYGDVLRLDKIPVREMSAYIRERFAESAKYLDIETASYIAELVDCHPLYTQLLAHQSYLAAAVVCSKEVIAKAHETIVDQMSLVFENLTASLTTQQLCYLHAVLAGETVISTSEVLFRHHISSATSASRSKTALLERGIICNTDGKISIADPIYASWLKSRYFAKK